MRARGFVAPLVSALMLVSVLVLSGCASAAGPEPEQVRGEFFSAVDETQELAGGVWENRDDPMARSCVIHGAMSGTEGEQYPALRIGTPPADRDAAVNDITTAWTRWGYQVDTMVVGDVTQLQVRGGLVLIFRVSDDAMTLQGESACCPEKS